MYGGGAHSEKMASHGGLHMCLRPATRVRRARKLQAMFGSVDVNPLEVFMLRSVQLPACSTAARGGKKRGPNDGISKEQPINLDAEEKATWVD